MRTLIYNANVVTGDGSTILENRSLILEDNIIDSIYTVPYPMYDFADYAIDARGGFVIPGLINRHTHCITMGPYATDYALPALPEARVRQNLKQHLLEGETTLISQDGFGTNEELEKARSFTPQLLQTYTINTPKHFEKAKTFSCGGLTDAHYATTAEERIKQGAIGIGEVGAFGIPTPCCGKEPDISYTDFMYIPLMVRVETGKPVSWEDARKFREAATTAEGKKSKLPQLMEQFGVLDARSKLEALVENSSENAWLNLEAGEEATQYAKKLNVPIDFHNAPQTREQILTYSSQLNSLFHAAHSNLFYSPSECVEVAKAVKKAGGWIDMSTGDFFRAGQVTPNHILSLALLQEGLADMISTDTSGGYWDSILKVLEYFIEQRVVTLPKAIALATKNVTDAIPNIAPNRGEIKEGKIADLVVVDPKSISKVNAVIIGGKIVVENGVTTY